MQFKLDCKLLLLTFIVSFNCNIGSTSILDWIWKTKTENANVVVANGVPLVSIPYEMMTDDDKFLEGAAKFTDMQLSSPLEICQHKVIMKIKTSCSNIVEEELAKLSVNLLNCQAAVEGRRTFACTEDMSLKQCTTDMDANMWNAYHLMSNRARAVCYAVRNTHFRALTELTVNKLMQSAHSQIQTLTSLKESQDRLEEQTMEALSSLSQGSKALLEQQQHLKDAQTTAHNLVTTNLRELANEKALIRSGHAQLATMAENIKDKLEKAHKDLEQHAVEQGENHKEVLRDLIDIQKQTRSIWEKIEVSTNRIVQQHEETIVQYEETMQKLVLINDTIQYIWNITNVMREEIDQKLGWITDYIGDTGEQVQRIYRTFLHVIYILVAMIVAAFLQMPFLTRATIMGIVPMNLVTYLKHGVEASLDFTAMTILIFLITAMHFVMLGIQRVFGPNSNARTEPVKVIHQNGNARVSSMYSNFMPKTHLSTRAMKKLQGFYNFIILQLNRCTEKINSLIRSIIGWSQRNFKVHEELSCSYQPSRKKREDIIDNYEPECSSILSEDLTDYDLKVHTPYKNYDYDTDDNYMDANKLKHTLRRVYTSRSVTPSSTSSTKVHCLGKTRNGTCCRRYPSPGKIYCYNHDTGASVMGD